MLIRPGCTTHHTDSEQRLVHLTASKTGGGLRVDCPTDPTVAPPGYYMVFIVDTQGRPCERAKFVRLCMIPKGACVAPVFEPSHWLVCLLIALIFPFVLLAFIVLLPIIALIGAFVPGLLARFLCNFRRYVYRLKHCRQGNRDACRVMT